MKETEGERGRERKREEERRGEGGETETERLCPKAYKKPCHQSSSVCNCNLNDLISESYDFSKTKRKQNYAQAGLQQFDKLRQ